MRSIMKNVLKSLVLPALAATAMLAPAGASAQSVYGGLALLTGFPSGEFHDNMSRTGFGISGNIGYHLDQAPLMFGIDGGVMIYGSEERTEPFSPTIPDVRVKVSTSNNIAQAHAFIRLQPAEGMVRPYIDGLVGVNYLFTSTSVQSENNADDEDIASSTNYDDAAFSYGGGAGLMIRLYQNEDRTGTDASAREVMLDLGVRYLTGGEAGYLTTGSIHRQNGTVSYDVTHSRTDLITGRIGVAVRF